MKKNILTKLLAFIIISCYLFTSFDISSAAANIANVKSEAGKIIFKTTDTKASTGVRWKTVGFTITRDKCMSGPEDNGGDPTKLDHATINLKPEWVEEDPKGDEIDITFRIPKAIVSKALLNAGFGEIRNNDIIYLHGIHQVTHDGKNYGGKKYTYSSICNAEEWANKDDFKDRFDIKVEYEGDKEPVQIEYKTSTGEIMATLDRAAQYPGTDLNVRLDTDRINPNDGKLYYLYKSYIDYLTIDKPIPNTGRNILNGDPFAEVQERAEKQRVGGVRFVAIMRLKKPTPEEETDPENSERIVNEMIEPSPHGVIGADYRNNEQFDAADGIPTTEDLYVNAFSSNYLLGYKLTKTTGTKKYPVNVSKTWSLTWSTSNPPDADGRPTPPTHHSATETVNKTVYVERAYSYWQISTLDYYGINNAKINNYALPGGSITLIPKGYTPPGITQIHRPDLTDHIKDPVYNTSLSLSGSISGGSSKPSVPNESFTSQADGVVPQIKVRNDKFIFDGKNIMTDQYVDTKAPAPVKFEIDTEEVNENVLYESALTIDRDKTNGEYETTGTMTYSRITSVNPEFDEELTYEITGLNNVVIHTPTVCDAYILPGKEYNQMLFPDKSAAPLVLDRYFNINLPTEGEHRYIRGYEYGDYGKYINRRQVKFPFDVYQGNNYIRAGTWHTLTSDITTFYMPIWVDEGNYTIDLRSISINADGNNAIEETESLANLTLSNYVATDTINVQVSGRIYGLNLYDISDYPIWKNVFRQPYSTIHTGFYYPVGMKDHNGNNRDINSKFTLPLVNGNHPTINNAGVLKTGYITRFSLITIGNMYDTNDYIKISPKFYYVDQNGNNRQEVDIYYSETFLDKKHSLIKMGSEKDQLNKKALKLGEVYRSVPSAEIATTARIKGVTEKVLKGIKRNVFTFMNIIIPENMRTFIGTNYSPTGIIPTGVDPDKVIKSKQRWYGEYYIPSEVHIVPKGFDVFRYAKEHGSIDYFEEIWLKDGYIIVNFDIETINDDTRYLSYINPINSIQGYCNMWNREGFQYLKTDEKGRLFQFLDGDYILYDTNQSAAIDYISRGTH